MTAKYIQKVTHVENFQGLLDLAIPQSAGNKNFKMTLVEKVNGFYAEITLGELLKTSGKLDFKSRQISTFSVESNLLVNQKSVISLARKVCDFIDAYTNNTCYTDDPERIYIAGELVAADQFGNPEKQNFDRTSSVLRKKEIQQQVCFLPFAIVSEKYGAISTTGKRKLVSNWLMHYWDPNRNPHGEINEYFKTLQFTLVDNKNPDITEAQIKTFIAENNLEGFVWYSYGYWFTNDKRTDDVVALKFPIFADGEIYGWSHANTVRGWLITKVKIRLSNRQEIIVGSGIDDNLRYLLNNWSTECGYKVKVTVKAEKITRLGAYLKPVISNYYKEQTSK